MMLDIELLAEIITNEIIKAIKAHLNNQTEEKPGRGQNISNTRKFNKRRIVCMEDLSDIKSGIFEVENNAIITPLAKDYLRDKKIRTVYR